MARHADEVLATFESGTSSDRSVGDAARPVCQSGRQEDVDGSYEAPLNASRKAQARATLKSMMNYGGIRTTEATNGPPVRCSGRRRLKSGTENPMLIKSGIGILFCFHAARCLSRTSFGRYGRFIINPIAALWVGLALIKTRSRLTFVFPYYVLLLLQVWMVFFDDLRSDLHHEA